MDKKIKKQLWECYTSKNQHGSEANVSIKPKGTWWNSLLKINTTACWANDSVSWLLYAIIHEASLATLFIPGAIIHS